MDIKFTQENEISQRKPVKIVSSFIGYEDYALGLDSCIDERAIFLGFTGTGSQLQFEHTEWWFPRYSYKVEGDSDFIEPSDIVVGKEYKIILYPKNFYYLRYEQYGDIYDILTQYSDKYEDCLSCEVGERVKVVERFPVRVRERDFTVFCYLKDRDKYTLLPYSVLYPLQIKPSYNPRKFVYEFKDWKKIH